MIDIRKFGSLGRADHGWLNARHHFSFAELPRSLAHGLGPDPRLERRRDRRQSRVSRRTRTATWRS
jgi:hypothetical protein